MTLKRNISLVVKYIILTFVLVVFFFPLLNMLIISLKSESQIFSNTGGLFPTSPKWSNYIVALTMIDYSRYLVNTCIMSVIYSATCTFSSALAGYAFARFRIWENELVFNILLSSIMIPYVITVIPFYFLVKNLGLYDNYLLWFLRGLAGAPFMIYFYRQFFMTIPTSFEEAALIDGANQWQIFFRVMLPLVKSGTIITAMFSFLFSWQDYLLPALFLSDKKQSLAFIMTTAYVDIKDNVLYGPLMSGTVYYVLVPIIIFIIFKRQIMSGMLDGGLKG
jgi:multiple sugar transport system permease protein